MRLHYVSGQLHAGEDLCLFRTRPDDTTPRTVLRALGRVMAEGMESATSVDGLRARRCAHVFGFPHSVDALAVLAASVEGVHVETSVASTIPRVIVEEKGKTLHIVITVAGEWMRSEDGDGIHANANESIAPMEATQAHAYVLTVDPTTIFASSSSFPLVAPPAPWRTVVDHADCHVRMCRSNATNSVVVYRYGILWDVSEDELEGIYVDATDLVLPLDAATHEAVDVVGDTFLRAEELGERGGRAQSELVCDLLTAFGTNWASPLKDVWRTDDVEKASQTLVNLMRDPKTPPSVVRLMDASHLLAQRVHHERTNLMAMTILRRMQTHEGGCTRDADWCATMGTEFAVARAEVAVVDAERFALIFSEASLPSCVVARCDHGLLVEDGDERILVVPLGATAASLTLAVATLLKCEVSLPRDVRTDLPTVFYFDTLYSEGSARCSSDEMLDLHTLHIDVDAHTLVVAVDREAPRVASARALSVDALTTRASTLWARNVGNADRVAVATLFPRVAHRLELSDHPLAACALEVQARRVAQEWTLEGFDGEKNLSSLAMTMLLGVALQGWIGYRVRVAMSRTCAAMIALQDATTEEWIVIDPTRTTSNLFEATARLNRLPLQTEPVRKDVLVELRKKTKWVAGIVTDHNEARGTFKLKLLHNDMEEVCSLNAHTWRRVTQDSSDLDKEVRTAVKRGAKRPRGGA